MPISSAVANLTVAGLNTTAPQVYWKGQRLLHLVKVRGHADSQDGEVTIRVNDPAGEQAAIYAEMAAAGITIKGA